ncbi:MAG TPA: ABC transporter ATP-binding protein [Bacillales bacterium]|nr:ABC transporter ATP-binding protein [Bacillales bacterium]
MSFIQAEALRYKYPMQESLALDHVSFEIEEGEFIGIIGENGAGKSTLCQAINGLVPHFHKGAYGGSIRVGGQVVKEAEVSELSTIAGLVFENPMTQMTGSKLTVYEEVAFGLENIGLPREQIIDRVDQALALMDLKAVNDQTPFALSGGQMQRVAIAGIIAMRPKIMLFDEPTSQLDPQGTTEVFRAIRKLSEEGVTVVVVTHKMELLANYADRILLMHRGKKIDFDTPERLFARTDLERYHVRAPIYTEVIKSIQQHQSETVPVTLEKASKWLVSADERD